MQETLRELEKFKKIKQEFNSAYNSKTFEFGRKEQPCQGKMSDLLRDTRKPKEQNLLKKLLSTYTAENSTRSLRILYIFTSDVKRTLSEAQKAFLTNFYHYLSLGTAKET